MGLTVLGVRYTGLGIHLKVSDITASRLFYEETLGLIPARGAGTAEFRRSLPDLLTAKHQDGLPGSPDASLPDLWRLRASTQRGRLHTYG